MKYVKIKSLLAALLVSAAAMAQDVDMNIITQENGVNDGNWTIGSTTCTVLMTVCNNDAGASMVPFYKLRPLLSVPSTIAQIAPNAQQTGLPPGWTIISNDGVSIRLSNGTDTWSSSDECRNIVIAIIPIAQGGPGTFTATMAFGNGLAPGNTPGPQTVGNDPANDNSTTAAVVASVLPLNFLSFDAAKQAGSVNLTWKTANEVNTNRFDVQFSKDGNAWASIGNVAAAGTSTSTHDYSFVHTSPINGANYYRLKQIDQNGAFKYSEVRVVKFSGGAVTFEIFPNPVKDKVFITSSGKIQKVSVINESGKLIVEATNFISGQSIDLTKYAAGVYLFRITDEAGNTETKKIVKY